MDGIVSFPSLIVAVNEFILRTADSLWVYPVLFGVCAMDGFFPPVPSETVVVSLAATSVTAGSPNVWLVSLLAAAGAVIGDNTAYAIGRAIGTTRFRWMRRPRAARTFAWARRMLDRRGAVLIMVARYIPVGRIAVNMAAGATGFPHRRFLTLTVIAGTSWSLYSVGIGVLAGSWVEDNTILAIALAVGIAAVLGMIVDRVGRRVTAHRTAGRAPVPRAGGEQ